MSLPHSRKGKSPPLPAFMVGRGVRPPLTTQERRPNQSPEAGKIELAAAVATALNNSEREWWKKRVGKVGFHWVRVWVRATLTKLLFKESRKVAMHHLRGVLWAGRTLSSPPPPGSGRKQASLSATNGVGFRGGHFQGKFTWVGIRNFSAIFLRPRTSIPPPENTFLKASPRTIQGQSKDWTHFFFKIKKSKNTWF